MAAGLTGAYAENIPNLELLTLIVFCSGLLLGVRDGAVIGAVTELVYSLLNPYGPAMPLITLAQVAGIAAAGAAGGVLAALRVERLPIALRATVLGATGAVVTQIFDILTNLATGIVYGQMKLWLIGGIPFSLWHTGWNVLFFAAVGTPLAAVLAHYRSRL